MLTKLQKKLTFDYMKCLKCNKRLQGFYVHKTDSEVISNSYRCLASNVLEVR